MINGHPIEKGCPFFVCRLTFNSGSGNDKRDQKDGFLCWATLEKRCISYVLATQLASIRCEHMRTALLFVGD